MGAMVSYAGTVSGAVDSVASAALQELTGIPGVRRAGIALTEGGGRRLLFRASDADGWCHIDAYDDVPLTTVVRSGEPVLGHLDALAGRYAGVVERQRSEGTRALAALPLAGNGAGGPVGGVMLYFDADQDFDEPQRRHLAEAAHRIAESVRRVRPADPALPSHDEPAGTHRATLRLDDDARGVGRARRFLCDLLAAWGVDDDPLETAVLCLSELVTNAIIHAGTGSRVTVSLDGGVLRVEVVDRGAGQDVVGPVDDEDPLRVCGRGLQLVDALADRWGSERDADGTRAWFDLVLAA